VDERRGVDVNRPGEAAYVGFPTFSGLPVALDPAALQGVDVAVVGAPVDETVVVRPGARFGPRAIRAAGYGGGLPNMDLGVSPFDVLTMVDHGDVVVTPADPKRSHAAIRSTVSKVMAARTIPIVLGGDHSIAHPDVGAVAEALRPAPLGLIHFDAHADDAEEMYGVVRSHGTPMRLLVNEGSVRGEHVVQVGLRGCWPGPEEFSWAREQGLRWHLMDEIHERGIRPVIEDVLRQMEGLPHVFLSVDIDVCDPAFAPGTGAPEPGGMNARDLLWAIRTLAVRLPIAGMGGGGVSPVRPCRDHRAPRAPGGPRGPLGDRPPTDRVGASSRAAIENASFSSGGHRSTPHLPRDWTWNQREHVRSGGAGQARIRSGPRRSRELAGSTHNSRDAGSIAATTRGPSGRTENGQHRSTCGSTCRSECSLAPSNEPVSSSTAPLLLHEWAGSVSCLASIRRRGTTLPRDA
jgi:agmatinase